MTSSSTATHLAAALPASPSQRLFLQFDGDSRAALPYAEVAAFVLSSSVNGGNEATKDQLRVGALSPTPSPNFSSQLIVPLGLYAKDKRTILTGKSTIARFLTRVNINSQSTLYEENTPAVKAQIDAVLDACRAFHKQPTNLNTLVNEAVKKSSTTPSSSSLLTSAGHLTLAEVMLWDLVKSGAWKSAASTVDVTAFINHLESTHPQFNQATQIITHALNHLPKLRVFKQAIATQVTSILAKEGHAAGCGYDVVFSTVNQNFKYTKDGDDFVLPIPRLGIKNVAPPLLAKSIVEKFKLENGIIKCHANGIFVYFSIDRCAFISAVIPQILTLSSKDYGNNASGYGQCAIVEYSSPNIAKPFHAGHLRSTIIGNFTKNVLVACGWGVTGVNYLGDWGKQYGLLALGFEKFGDRVKLKENPIKHLFDVYVQINKEKEADVTIDDQARAYFKRMEDGEAEGLKLWKEFRDLSIEKYKEMYARLNIYFDIYSGESQYSLQQMSAVIDELNELGLLTPLDGAAAVNLTSYDLGNAVITKSDGSMLYLSRDIAAAMDRYETFRFDKMYYVVGIQQDHHFKQLFKILDLMGKPWAKSCQHIEFGMIEGMSTRKGNVVFLEEMLDQTRDEMHDVMRKNEKKYAQVHDPEFVADRVGLSSIVIQDLSARRNKNYEFNWTRMLSFEGDTGPYLQYAHARLCSMERTNSAIDVTSLEGIQYNLLVEPEAYAIVEMISRYPSLVQDISKNMEPSALVTFLYELGHRISAAWEVLWVLNRPPEEARARMALYKAARITMGNGLSLLGLKPLERM